MRRLRSPILGILLFLLRGENCWFCLGHQSESNSFSEDSQLKYFEKTQHGACDKKGGDDCDNIKCIWGYEDECKENDKKYSQPVCSHVEGDWRYFRSNEDRISAFWNENDFGYVRSVNRLNYICEPKNPEDSSFECNDQLTFCRGKNIFFDLGSPDGKSVYERERSNPFTKGQFGGSCLLHPERFKHPHIFRDKLRSWAANDIDHFDALPFKPSNKDNCDVMVETPTIIMDLDFVGSLYHHFCDFFNLYLTLHVNNSFSQPRDIAYWGTSERLGPFNITWKAFTKNVYPLWIRYAYQKVCFKDVVFALLPRMAYGMYYSTPVVAGCSKSGLFKAFSEHVINGLSVKQMRKSKAEPLRITLLYRTTQFRRIINQEELLQSIRAIPNVVVSAVDFNWNMPFLEQLEISHNSDIFIGIHGAGLAHTLFLPDWAVLFELYNTEDVNCYKDLANLRGVKYITWEKKEKLKDETDNPDPNYDYEKFKNYRFDVAEFKRLLTKAITHAEENLASTVFT